MRRKVIMILSVLAAICLILVVGSMAAAGLVFDSKVSSVLRRVEQKVPGLELAYREQGSSIFSRSGVISWRLNLPKGNALGLPYVSGSTLMELHFGALSANAAFLKVQGEGNLDEFLARLHLQPIDYQGALEVTALMPKLSFALKSSPFSLPFEFGHCAVGENSVYFEASSPESMLVEAASGSLKCRGNQYYAGRESFVLDLSGLQVKAELSYVDGRILADSFEFTLANLSADFSTLFAIGFEPDAKVKDSTLRDALSFTNIKAGLAFRDKDSAGRAYLDFNGSGNFAFSFPAVKEGVSQPPYRIDNLKLEGSAGKLDVKRLFKALPHAADENGLNELFACFSEQQEMQLDDFSFEHAGQQVSVSGESSARFDFAVLKARSVKADFKLKGGAVFVNELAGEDYGPALAEMCRQGQVDFDGSTYQSRLTINDKDIRLNGLPLKLQSEADDAY